MGQGVLSVGGEVSFKPSSPRYVSQGSSTAMDPSGTARTHTPNNSFV